MNKDVFLVIYDAVLEGHSAEPSVLGVYDSEESAMEAIKNVNRQILSSSLCSDYTKERASKDDIFDILHLKLNETNVSIKRECGDIGDPVIDGGFCIGFYTGFYTE